MKPTYAEIQEQLHVADTERLLQLRISVLRNVTVESIKPYLQYYAYKMGLGATVTFGEYDNIYQEAVGGRADLLNADTDCVLVFMNLAVLSPRLANCFPELESEEIWQEVKRIEEHIQAVLTGIRAQTNAAILWHAFEMLMYPNFGIWDYQTNSGQTGTIELLNKSLREVVGKTVNTYVVDVNLCIYRIGAKSAYDLRFWHIGRAPYSREALHEIAFEDSKFIRAFKGKNKKCLVLDCDNTLWGGIIGEDGLEGIKLGRTHPGSAYCEFQQEIVNLYNRGVIIAICSKNNEQDVWEVFRKHPDMVLREAHIATAQVNWEDKATNLLRIAEDLNIGLDSIVFVDDRPAETSLIEELLPEVETILLPQDEPTKYRTVLASCGLFDTPLISEVDRKRGRMYKAEIDRKHLRARLSDLLSYYHSLEMVLEIRLADSFSIPRIAQLTQRTNQFNLTTRRYSEADISAFAEDPRVDVLYARLSDKFGDSGIIGVCILRYAGRRAVIDTFLLSCRVLGRGIEDAFLQHALELAGKHGSEVAVGEFCQTRKNEQVKGFYSKQGFRMVHLEDEAVDETFVVELSAQSLPETGYFKEIRVSFR